MWASVSAQLLALDEPPEAVNMRAWMFQTIQDATRELLLRKAKEFHSGGAEADPAAAGLGLYVQPTQEDWSEALFVSVLGAVKRRVSPISFRILRLCMKGKEAEEVAQIVGTSPQQVRYRNFKTLRKLEVGLALFSGEPLESGDS